MRTNKILSNKKMLGLSAAVVMATELLLGSINPISANTITLQNLSQDAATGEYQYTITLDGQTYLKTGDGFVMYNFPDLVTSGLDAPSISVNTTPFNNFSYTYATYSNAPANALTDASAAIFADDNAIPTAAANLISSFTTTNEPNITFHYDGTSPYIANGTIETATLTLYTQTGLITQASVYSSVDRSGTNPGSTYGFAQGTIAVPTTPTPSPEPATLALFAVGGLALLASAHRRRNRV